MGEGLWLTTIILFIIWSTGNIMYYGIFFYLPEYLSKAKSEDEDEVYLDVAIGSFGQGPGCLITILMLDSIGRRRTMLAGAVGTVGFMFAFGLILGEHQDSWLIVACVVGIKFFMAINYVAIYTYTSEVFPTQVRATGMGSCTVIKQVSVLMVPLLGAYFNSISSQVAVYFFASVGLVGAIIMTQLPIETAGQGLNDSLKTQASTSFGRSDGDGGNAGSQTQPLLNSKTE